MRALFVISVVLSYFIQTSLVISEELSAESGQKVCYIFKDDQDSWCVGVPAMDIPTNEVAGSAMIALGWKVNKTTSNINSGIITPKKIESVLRERLGNFVPDRKIKAISKNVRILSKTKASKTTIAILILGGSALVVKDTLEDAGQIADTSKSELQQVEVEVIRD